MRIMLMRIGVQRPDRGQLCGKTRQESGGNAMQVDSDKSLGRTLQVSGAALAAVLLSSTGAWAQCVDNFNLAAVIAGVGLQPVQRLVPLGTGPSLQSLTS